MKIIWKKYNVLVLGIDGMLGHDVFSFLEEDSNKKLSMLNRVVGLTGNQCRQFGFTDGLGFESGIGIETFFGKSIKFDYVVNCIAHTDTTDIETNEIGREKSYIVNSVFPGVLSKCCNRRKIKLIHISTDYVFSEILGENDLHSNTSTPCPKNIYGYHKLIGEMMIERELPESRYTIIRTSSLYGMHRSKSFVHKVLKNYYKIALENEENKTVDKKMLYMVDNAYSCPTSTNIVKHSILDIIKSNKHGIFNACGSCENKGVTPYQFAMFIIREFGEMYCNIKNNDIFNFGKPYIKDVLQKSYDFHPRFSSMTTDIQQSRTEYCYSWENELFNFLSDNKLDLIEFLENN